MIMKKYRLIRVILFFILVLAGIASIIGVFYRGDMKSVEVISERGEKYEMVTNGIYKFNAKRMAAEGIGWDIFTLIIVLPCLLIAILFLKEGLNKVILFIIGVLAYLFYQYFMYALAWAFGKLFLLYILIYVLCLWGMIWLINEIDFKRLNEKLSSNFPRVSMIVMSIFMAILLLVMWLGRIIAGLRGDLAGGMLLGQTTMVVQALDLGLIVPIALFNAYLLFKKHSIGYLLSSIIVIKAIAMAGAISLMVIVALYTGSMKGVIELIIFISIMIFMIYLAFKIYKNA